MRKINYPLIVSDFDGTLVRKDGTISTENKHAIEEYRKAGGAFVISSGRLPQAIIPRARELGLRGLISTCNGAIILDIESEKVVLEGKIPHETTYKIVKKMEELNLHIHNYYDLVDYYVNKDDEALKFYESIVKSKAKVIQDKPLSEHVKENKLETYKVLSIVPPSEIKKLITLLKEENFENCVVTKSAEVLIEILNAKYSKGTAVEFLANYYNVPIEKTIAVGDQLNDVDMIVKAGLGVAVANAENALKLSADYVCDLTNEEDAIAQIIDKFGFYEEEKA